jgi:hypothetical protein
MGRIGWSLVGGGFSLLEWNKDESDTISAPPVHLAGAGGSAQTGD